MDLAPTSAPSRSGRDLPQPTLEESPFGGRPYQLERPAIGGGSLRTASGPAGVLEEQECSQPVHLVVFRQQLGYQPGEPHGLRGEIVAVPSPSVTVYPSLKTR